MYKAYHILYIVHTYTVSDTYFFFLDSLFVDACRHMKIDLYVLESVYYRVHYYANDGVQL